MERQSSYASAYAFAITYLTAHRGWGCIAEHHWEGPVLCFQLGLLNHTTPHHTTSHCHAFPSMHLETLDGQRLTAKVCCDSQIPIAFWVDPKTVCFDWSRKSTKQTNSVTFPLGNKFS